VEVTFTTVFQAKAATAWASQVLSERIRRPGVSETVHDWKKAFLGGRDRLGLDRHRWSAREAELEADREPRKLIGEQAP